MFLSKRLPRRALLRGVGSTLALPMLDAMFPAGARPAAIKSVSPCRMAFLYVPNGIIMEEWRPKTDRKSATLPAELPRITQVLAPWREQFSLLGGLTQNAGRALGDGPGDHGRAGASYLTAVHPKKTYGKDIQAGVSADQIAARWLEGKTLFASLELGCEEGVQGGNCDNGYSCAYSNSISWRSPSSPMPPEIRPRAVFERLFGSVDAERDPRRRGRQEKYETSILDTMLEDARRLQASLGGADRAKLGEYLFTVRDVEKRIHTAERREPLHTGAEAPPSGVPADFGEHARLVLDMLALAFQADMTRVATVLMGVEQSPRSYGEIGIPEAHHGLTHHQGDKEKIEKVTRINCFHMHQFAHLLERLSSIRDGDGTLLDHCMIVYGSGLSDGNRHDHNDLPTVLAGRGCGALRPGRHIRYADETPMANLFVALLDRMGVPIESIGDSTGKLGYLSEV
jgi:hypothetical protein